jgi:hypothetical protein
MTERDESTQSKPTSKSLGDRAREIGDRVREAVNDILEALDELVAPAPTAQPIPVRGSLPARARRRRY